MGLLAALTSERGGQSVRARAEAGDWGLRQQSGLTRTVATSSAMVVRAAASGPPVPPPSTGTSRASSRPMDPVHRRSSKAACTHDQPQPGWVPVQLPGMRMACGAHMMLQTCQLTGPSMHAIMGKASAPPACGAERETRDWWHGLLPHQVNGLHAG